ncbi:MAG: hypothetical protein CVT89_02265 [Candidatus Altiarchaeales archaeon HGW-Altiarchaeales-2]|nr:MAG: hypothetical protein CVT89_02265 [Candidatus Altiarchaeales archaeon HGW-Altiarchaeales-2]
MKKYVVIVGIILLAIGLVVPMLRIFEVGGTSIKYSLSDASRVCSSLLGTLAADSCNTITLISTILTIVWVVGICLIIYGVIGEKSKERFKNNKMTDKPIGILVCVILFVIGGVFLLFVIRDGFVIVGVAELAVAYGIWNMKKWAKILGIILAIIDCTFAFPIGAIIGLIILYFLLIDKKTKNAFHKMKICPKCGKEYPDIEKFCSLCGEKLIMKEERSYTN